ncbi:hypothetical protein Z550_04138, partial [Mycobacterium tuberculosis 3280CJ]|uniref:PPE domain-containing protein n=1 Tax=Mycobacterium tuberculosis TaxID=1773 RepID=UPI00045A0F38
TRGCLLRSTPETSRRLRSQIRESPDSPGRFTKRLWQTANTIHHLANTYEDIRQRVVPPAAIEDNREEVRRLIASDITGENAPAIAELDEQYQSYGDTNVQAMNLYAERAQTLLSQLPRWQEPPQIHQRGRGG